MDAILQSLIYKKDITVFWWFQVKDGKEFDFDFDINQRIEKAYSICQETGEIPNKIRKIEIKGGSIFKFDSSSQKYFFFIHFDKDKSNEGELLGAGSSDRIVIIRKRDSIEKHAKHYSKFLKK